MRLDPTVVVGAVALTAYVAIGVIVKDLYPFSSFPMYAGRSTSASRLLLRDARGAVHEVTSYGSFFCPRPLDVGAARCPGSFQTVEYLDDADARWIDGHASVGPGGDDVTLVRRIWTFPDAGGPPTAVDCTLATCSAQRAQ